MLGSIDKRETNVVMDATPRHNVLAIVSLILAFVAPVIGVILGITALGRDRHKQRTGRGLAIAAVAVGSALTVLQALSLILWFSFTSEVSYMPS